MDVPDLIGIALNNAILQCQPLLIHLPILNCLLLSKELKSVPLGNTAVFCTRFLNCSNEHQIKSAAC